MDNNRNQNREGNPSVDKLSSPGRGPQGIDKAPGEETAQSTENVMREAQKGKNKVDGDPSKKSDQPLDKDQLL